MLKKPALFPLLLAFAVGVNLPGSALAQNEKKDKMKEKEKATEKAPEKAPEKEKAAPKEKKSSVEWVEAAKITGTIKNTTTVIVSTTNSIPRNNQAAPPLTYTIITPVRHDFSVEAAAWRIKWDIEGTTERGAKLKVILYKEEERGKSKDWKKKGLIPARPGSESEQVFTLGPGNYYLELTGNDAKYTFTVEGAQKAAK